MAKFENHESKPQKKALILNASHNDMRMIQALKALGYYVITIGQNPGLIGEKYADEYICQDYSDEEATLALAKGLNIDAICSCCNDFGVLTAAYVAERLKLPGHDSYEVAQVLHHKDRFKSFARELGIKTPLARVFINPQAALEWIKFHGEYPLMVKAPDLSAGNGITKVCRWQEARPAVELAFEKSRTKSIVVEPYIEGTQHAICTFLIDRKVVAACSNNEYSFINPYRVEIDTFPADGIEALQDRLIAEIEKMAEALHLTDGIFEMQYHMTPDGDFWIMECMRRVLGNLYSIPSSSLMGFNWDYWEVRARCGLGCRDFPLHAQPSGFFAYRALIAEKNGIYKSLNVADSVRQYIVETCMLQDFGYEIRNHKSDPMGFLFFSFPDRETMDSVMVDQYRNVKVEVEELL